jgi:hypothetical protein
VSCAHTVWPSASAVTLTLTSQRTALGVHTDGIHNMIQRHEMTCEIPSLTLMVTLINSTKQRLTVPLMFSNFALLYETRMFITVFTKALK